MARYAWKGETASGDARKGTMDAPDQANVSARLREQGITPKKIKKAGGINLNFQFGTGVETRDILIFTRQLATMVDAGLPLVQCLDILATQSENKAFQKVLFGVKYSIEAGSTFSDALAKHPKVFDALFVNLVAAGEIGGILDTILNRLSAYIEKAEKLKRQVKSAMVYPIAIFCVAILVVVVMLTKVIPVFEDMYKSFKGAVLPKPTRVIMGMSHGFIDNWWWFVGGAIGFVVALSAFKSTKRGRALFDRFLLRVPIIGPTMRKIVVARFTRTLGTLLSSGVPILDALSICSKTAGNVIVGRAVMYAREKISEGKDLAGPLGETKVFPPMVIQMISVGEQTGAMDQMLQKIADFYEDEVDIAVAAMTSLMEPIMMVLLGGVIGGLIVAMYLPIFELAGNIKHGQ